MEGPFGRGGPWQIPPDLRMSLYIDEYNAGKEHRDGGISGQRTQQADPAW
jgi:hypothetical protein